MPSSTSRATTQLRASVETHAEHGQHVPCAGTAIKLDCHPATLSILPLISRPPASSRLGVRRNRMSVHDGYVDEIT